MDKTRKLSLELDALLVDTFATAETEADRGTVLGHEPADTASGDFRGCACDTRENTCWGGCAPSQPHTCPRPGACEEQDTWYMTCFGSCAWQGGQAVLLPNC